MIIYKPFMDCIVIFQGTSTLNKKRKNFVYVLLDFKSCFFAMACLPLLWLYTTHHKKLLQYFFLYFLFFICFSHKPHKYVLFKASCLLSVNKISILFIDRYKVQGVLKTF